MANLEPTQTIKINPDGEASTVEVGADNNFTANIGEVNVIRGIVTIVDQYGNILCRQQLVGTNTVITGGAVFVSSSYDNTNQSFVNRDVALTANPVIFATANPG